MVIMYNVKESNKKKIAFKLTSILNKTNVIISNSAIYIFTHEELVIIFKSALQIMTFLSK